jgi:hypothetical protein
MVFCVLRRGFFCTMGFLIAAKQLCNRYCSKKQQEPRSRALRMLGKGLLESNPTWVGSRSPMGWWFGLAPSHPGVWGSIPKREEPRKTGAPCIKVPGSSRVPLPPREQLCNRYCSNRQQQHIHPFNNHHRAERWFDGWAYYLLQS